MLYWAAVFLIIAVIARGFGYLNISVAAKNIAKVLFYIFLAVFGLFLLVGLLL